MLQTLNVALDQGKQVIPTPAGTSFRVLSAKLSVPPALQNIYLGVQDVHSHQQHSARVSRGQKSPTHTGIQHPAQGMSVEQLTLRKGFALFSRVKVKCQQTHLVFWASQD